MEDLLNEVFKDCPFNHSLQVSQYGRIKNKKTGQILEPIVIKNHYAVEDPSGKHKTEWVHRLVALTWLKEDYKKNEKNIVHHLNRNSFDNKADNLIWVDLEDHLYLHGSQREDNYKDKIKIEHVIGRDGAYLGEIIYDKETNEEISRSF